MNQLTRKTLAALLLASAAAPALAEDYPLKPGPYLEVAMIAVDDGHSMDYAKFLASQWKDEQEFAKSKGWISGYQIMANVHKRPGEADLLLVIEFKSLPDAVEMETRDKAYMAHMKSTDDKMDAASGERAKFRHVIGGQLWQEMLFK